MNANNNIDVVLNTSKLEKELTSAFEIDAKRKAEDTTKKKAILTAKSYDEFRNLVATATQLPIDRSDMAKRADVSANKALALGAGATAAQQSAALNFGFGVALPEYGNVSSGSIASNSAANRAASASAMLLLSSSSTNGSGSSGSSSASSGQLPKSPGEFDRTWRRLPSSPPSIRYTYLVSTLGAEYLKSNVFKADIDGTCLAAIIVALGNASSSSSSSSSAEDTSATNATPDTAVYDLEKATDILLALTNAGRFSLASAMLSKEAMKILGDFVRALEERGGEGGGGGGGGGGGDAAATTAGTKAIAIKTAYRVK